MSAPRTPLRILIAALLLTLTFPIPSQAAPNLKDVQAQIEALQEEAATAGEGAQEAKVKLASLNRALSSVAQQQSVEKSSVAALKSSMGAMASTQYKSAGLSDKLDLLFSADPTAYLAAAGSLEAVVRKKSIQLRKYTSASQRLAATTLILNDKLAQVKATQILLQKRGALVRSKLVAAEKLLEKLEKTDRERLKKIQERGEDADQASSLLDAASANGVSGRAGIALRFALKQIGDRYVWGAAGPIKWDCSGLTMRAFQAAGVSLPHYSGFQYRYGKSISRKNLLPGDLLFFGRPISHVSIYLGKGKMVYAPRPGSRVKVGPFSSSFGKKPYIGARRL